MNADFRLGGCIVRPRRRIIERGNQSIHVKPKSMAVFECLMSAGCEPVSRDDLFDKVWPGVEVTDDTLTRCIAELRKAFGDSARESRVIETIPKLGFRLVLPAEPLEVEQISSEDSPPRPGKWRRLGLARLLLVGVVLVFGVLISSLAARLWLTEAGVTLLMKTAAIIAPHSLTPEPGIAVLPFENISGDPENEYFSVGMSAEVLNALGRTNRLPVIARNSSFQFKGQNRDVKEIGRLLGVTYVLEGSVRRADNSIRLTAQLIETATGIQAWSGVYQRELGDIFMLQNEIASSIVDQVIMALGDAVAQQPQALPKLAFMRTQPPSDPEAYELYLKGVEMVTSDRPLLIEQASGYFDRAISLDSNYADAWAGRGYSLAILSWIGSGSSRIPASVFPEAIAALRRALEIEPRHAFAMGWLGVALMVQDFKWAEGMQLLEESLTRNPNNADLLAVFGYYMELLDMKGADEVIERAYRLDPFSIETIVDRAIFLSRKGRLLEAVILVETALIKDPEGYAANLFSAGYNLSLDRLDAAEQRLAKARLVAKPIDLTLDTLQWRINRRRGKGPLPKEEIWERMQTEKLNGAVLYEEWESEEEILAVFDLAIKQRHPALRAVLFGPRPPMMPEADWRRIKEITGVTQYLSTR